MGFSLDWLVNPVTFSFQFLSTHLLAFITNENLGNQNVEKVELIRIKNKKTLLMQVILFIIIQLNNCYKYYSNISITGANLNITGALIEEQLYQHRLSENILRRSTEFHNNMTSQFGFIFDISEANMEDPKDGFTFVKESKDACSF